LYRHLFLFTLFANIFFVAVGQQALEYSFKRFSLANGLSTNTVTSIVQDKDGYMWIGTSNGLNRFDGSRFIKFNHDKKNAHSIPHQHITRLYKDKNNTIWIIGNNNKIGTWNTIKHQFNETPLQSDIDKGYSPKRFIETPDGKILIHVYKQSVYEYIPDSRRFIENNNIIQKPAGWSTNFITWDSYRNKYWIASDSGLALFNPINKKLSYRHHNVENEPAIEQYKSLTRLFYISPDSTGNLFVANWPPFTGAGVFYRFNNKTGTSTSHSLVTQLQIGYHEVYDFLQQRSGRTWVYGLNNFAEWSEKENKFIGIPNELKNEQSIKYDAIHYGYEDKENNLWMATDNGLFLFNPENQIFNTYKLIRPGEPAKDNPVHAVAELHDNRIFIGAWGEGLFAYDQNLQPIELPSSLQPGSKYSIWDMHQQDKNSWLWITQQSGVLTVYDPKTNTAKTTSPSIFKNSTIRQVVEDNDGNMWFGTQDGQLVKWDLIVSAGDPTKGYEHIASTGRVFKLHVSQEGFIWVGTTDNGLLKVNPKTKKIIAHYTVDGKAGERLFTNSLNDITQLNDSLMVMAGGALHILNKNTNKIRFISTDDGLPVNEAISVQKDASGIIWVGMSNGLSRINMAKQIVTSFDSRDGIANDRFISTGIEKLNDGRIILYTPHNFLVFHPSRFQQTQLPPPPYITSVQVGNKLLDLDSLIQNKKLSLEHNNTSFGIDFSSLSYVQQRKVHFYYMLEGIDNDWLHSDEPMLVSYNYLPSGTYTFKVKTENADGITHPSMANLIIEVKPPFWKSWWFISFIILLVILIFYTIDKERVRRLQSLQRVRTHIAESLHHEINTELNNINVLSEIAKIKVDRDIDQSKEFIDQISNRSRYMIESMDDMLWSIQPENDSMKQTINRVREVTDNLMSAYNTEIDLIVDHKLYDLNLDMKLRHDIFFYYKEAISFMLENLKCSQVFANFSLYKQRLKLELHSYCPADKEKEILFKKRIKNRISDMDATVDVSCDNKTFSAVLSAYI
jgi:ligand-binding sensor domain-containing protein